MRVNKEILYFDLGYEWFKYEKHTAARMEQGNQRRKKSVLFDPFL